MNVLFEPCRPGIINITDTHFLLVMIATNYPLFTMFQHRSFFVFDMFVSQGCVKLDADYHLQ